MFEYISGILLENLWADIIKVIDFKGCINRDTFHIHVFRKIQNKFSFFFRIAGTCSKTTMLLVNLQILGIFLKILVQF